MIIPFLIILTVILVAVLGLASTTATTVSTNAAQIANAAALAEIGQAMQAQADATTAVARAGTHQMLITVVVIVLVMLVSITAGVAVGRYLRQPQTTSTPRYIITTPNHHHQLPQPHTWPTLDTHADQQPQITDDHTWWPVVYTQQDTQK